MNSRSALHLGELGEESGCNNRAKRRQRVENRVSIGVTLCEGGMIDPERVETGRVGGD